jgi:hypothetical protein
MAPTVKNAPTETTKMNLQPDNILLTGGDAIRGVVRKAECGKRRTPSDLISIDAVTQMIREEAREFSGANDRCCESQRRSKGSDGGMAPPPTGRFSLGH